LQTNGLETALGGIGDNSTPLCVFLVRVLGATFGVFLKTARCKMRPFVVSMFLILVAYGHTADNADHAAKTRTVRGWLSDEQCAKGRASSGVFTGTNPSCAKECIAKGRKIVLIDPDAKEVVRIENQEAARANIGDYVEIEGSVGSRPKVLHIDSLRLLSVGAAACAREKLKN
jgi:hypothetical protein